MKELFQLLAKYNIQANQDMIHILDQVSNAKLAQDIGAYYTSILGILNHVLLSNIYWIKRLAKYIPEITHLIHEIPDVQPKNSKEVVWDTLAKLKPVLLKVDDQLKNLVNALPEQQFTETIKYTSSKGGESTMVVWQVLLHLFNHHTHNRGQIAVLLDQFDVENDFSSILWRKYQTQS